MFLLFRDCFDEFLKINKFIIFIFHKKMWKSEVFSQALFSDEYNLIIFFFDLSDKKATKRILNRVICKNCNTIYNKVYYPSKFDEKCDNCSENLFTRIDDNQEVIIKRLTDYNNQLPKLTKFYMQKNNVFHLDADQPRDKIFIVIKDLLLHVENTF
ncbi:MAG: adenylate kinase [Candidatus Anoxychlamydiales bacterium]|nr:adenylate kinase [Candidatus Anoxychlamydiales bacterium]